MAQLLWVPRHLADIESDMSAVHRVDDIWSMESARFFRLAWRLPCYRGVMRERVIAEQREQDRDDSERPRRRLEQWERDHPRAAPARGYRPRPAPQPVTEAVLADPVMGKIFSFG